jgi:hypothetical protein
MTLIQPVQMRPLPPELRGPPITSVPFAAKVTSGANPAPKTRLTADGLAPPVISVAPAAAAFAIATTHAHRQSPPPLQPGELPLPADPLPDLPAAGMENPVPPEDRTEAAQQDSTTLTQLRSDNTLLSPDT